jgi:hypothetical protein
MVDFFVFKENWKLNITTILFLPPFTNERYFRRKFRIRQSGRRINYFTYGVWDGETFEIKKNEN